MSDDITMIREVLLRYEQHSPDVERKPDTCDICAFLDALDRLVAERDRLREALREIDDLPSRPWPGRHTDLFDGLYYSAAIARAALADPGETTTLTEPGAVRSSPRISNSGGDGPTGNEGHPPGSVSAADPGERTG